jgi:hypothetical protein
MPITCNGPMRSPTSKVSSISAPWLRVIGVLRMNDRPRAEPGAKQVATRVWLRLVSRIRVAPMSAI